MAYLSSTARSLLSILNNINDLIVLSNNRQDSKDVMRALVVYAKNKNFDIPQDKIDSFYSILLDSRPITLSHLIMDIAQDIAHTDKIKNKK
jgi:hypothetical protein